MRPHTHTEYQSVKPSNDSLVKKTEGGNFLGGVHVPRVRSGVHSVHAVKSRTGPGLLDRGSVLTPQL